MQIVNDTDQDARVRVAGGGAGMDKPGRSAEKEDPSKWHLLPSKGTLAPQPPGPGPWTVYFVVNGCRIVKEVRSGNSVVRLQITPASQTFEARIN